MFLRSKNMESNLFRNVIVLSATTVEVEEVLQFHLALVFKFHL